MTTFRTMSVRTSSKGFTLIEIMMVVAIIGLLAGLAIPKFMGYVEKARVARAVAEIRDFETEIFAYYISNEKYPYSLTDLGRTFTNILDPWGNPYQYLLIDGTRVPGSGRSASNGGFSGVATAASGGSEGASWDSLFFGVAWAAPPSPPPPPSGGGGGSPPSGGGGTPPSPPPPPSGGSGGSPPSGGGDAQPRKDRFLVPINSDYDLYSVGPDGESTSALTAAQSRDDIIRASDGAYVGVAENF